MVWSRVNSVLRAACSARRLAALCARVTKSARERGVRRFGGGVDAGCCRRNPPVGLGGRLQLFAVGWIPCPTGIRGGCTSEGEGMAVPPFAGGARARRNRGVQRGRGATGGLHTFVTNCLAQGAKRSRKKSERSLTVV